MRNHASRGTNKVKTVMQGMYRSLSYVGNHAPVVVDEPLHLFGEDTAPAPGKVVMPGLGGCLAVGITAVATWKKVKLTKLDIYLEGDSGNPALSGGLLAKHGSGQTLGATGMSNPMKTFAGIETFLLHAKKVEEGYVVNCTLPWVSNLGPDHYFGAVADVVVDGVATSETTSEVMFLVRCNAPGVELRNCPSFSAMEGANTWAVRLTNYFVGSDLMIADPVRPFIGRIRAAFILLQTGMGLGVAQGAIDSMWTVERQLEYVNEFLDDRPDDLQAELDELTARIMELAETPFGTDKAFLIAVLDARAHASELALRAAQSALLHQGERGYLMTSEVQRRVRESHFVAIVTPAIKHLRKEIARLSAEELPA